MVKKEKSSNASVKKETMLIVAFCCLIIGFVGGIAFSVYKNVAPTQGQAKTGMQTIGMKPVQPEGPTAEQLKHIQHLAEQTSRNPQDNDAWTQLGNAYFDTSEYTAAIQAYKKALDIKPDDPDVWTDLGIMYRRDGMPDKAIDAFDKAIAIDPRHEPSLFNKGLVLMHDLNDSKGAIKAWEALIAINPDAIAPGGGQSIKDLLEKMKSMPPR